MISYIQDILVQYTENIKYPNQYKKKDNFKL